MKTYVFVGGLTVEQALEKVKKYYPNYNGTVHKSTIRSYPENGCVSNVGNSFKYCFEQYYIDKGYTRLDKEETMNNYYKIETHYKWIVKNLKLNGFVFSGEEAYACDSKSFYPSANWPVHDVKNIELTTEEEYNKFKNPSVTVSLNIDYSAVISKDGIKVGCQNFTHEAIQNLAKELEKFLDKQ